MNHVQRLRRRRSDRVLFLLVGCGLLTACGALAEKPEADSHLAQRGLPEVTLCLHDDEQALVLSAERASTNEQRRIGLMGRPALPWHHGMLFVYPHERDADATFWMYRTRIALDIAYLGPTGQVRAIDTMVPCLSGNLADCPSYQAGVPYWTALEVNGGFFEREGFGVGAQVTQTEPDRCTPGMPWHGHP